MKLITWANLGSLLLFTSCLTDKTSKVEPAAIATDYTLHYDDTDKSVIGEVKFTTQEP